MFFTPKAVFLIKYWNYKNLNVNVLNCIIWIIFNIGPTLSTSTSSFEALDPYDPNLSCLATTMFQKTADYLYGELSTTQVKYINNI